MPGTILDMHIHTTAGASDSGLSPEDLAAEANKRGLTGINITEHDRLWDTYKLNEYRERYFNGDKLAFMRTYFSHLAQAAESGLFDCISHPDLIKNIFPRSWNFEVLMDDICACLERIAKTGIAMELNTSGLQKAIREMNPGPAMLREMCLRKIPVVLGSDSHIPRRVGADFESACGLLEAAGYAEVSYFIGRKRRTLALKAARESLR